MIESSNPEVKQKRDDIVKQRELDSKKIESNSGKNRYYSFNGSLLRHFLEDYDTNESTDEDFDAFDLLEGNDDSDNFNWDEFEGKNFASLTIYCLQKFFCKVPFFTGEYYSNEDDYYEEGEEEEESYNQEGESYDEVSEDEEDISNEDNVTAATNTNVTISRYTGIPGAYYGGFGHCFHCGDQGHWANGCPNRADLDQTCFSCGNQGHFSNACPERDIQCFLCGRTGHRAALCHSS